MKKLLVMILALLPVVCSAQIKITNAQGDPSKTIVKFHVRIEIGSQRCAPIFVYISQLWSCQK